MWEKNILWKIKEKLSRCHISMVGGGAQNEQFRLGHEPVLHRPCKYVVMQKDGIQRKILKKIRDKEPNDHTMRTNAIIQIHAKCWTPIKAQG